MKKIFVIILVTIGLSLPCLADSTVDFSWDPGLESNLVGYRLYQTLVQGEYVFGDGKQIATIPAGIEVYSLQNVTDEKWYWVIVKYDTEGLEIGCSSEVTRPFVTPFGLRIQ